MNIRRHVSERYVNPWPQFNRPVKPVTPVIPVTNNHRLSANSFRTGTTKAGASNPKEIMLNWCKAMTKDYAGVDVQNFGSSWADGLAFCALIHHFYPDAFDFSTLEAKNKRANFTLAFEKADKLGNVAALLDVEDLMRMKVPDWKCVFTQIQLYYKRFQLMEGKGANVPPTGKALPKPSSTSTTEEEEKKE